MRLISSAAVTLGLVGLAAPSFAGEITTQLPRTVRPTHYEVALTPQAEALTFDGKAVISLDVLTPTASITLNAIDMKFASARLSGPGGERAATVAVDAARQEATFTFDAPLAAGSYRLALDYAGVIGTQAVGLFALDYESAEGKRRGLFTQFENSDARRMVPCWDEPIHKATFDLTVTVPKGQMAVSNMPAAETTPLPDGGSRVRFARSPRMSTYLLFLAMGELERATVKVGETEVGVVTRKGALDQAKFVLDASAEALREYNDYFGAPYPLPKLDNVAAPGRSQFFGAMENWGAILSFEYILLVDPTISTQEDRQGVFSVAAHEISHQWFGDLVTMAWWDDLWLNEGFASWMAGRTTAKLRPEWNTHLGVVRSRDDAMARDALATTHPVVQRIETVEQASQAFDSITYQKGEAVIRMLEGYVGPDAWRAGVRRYIEKYAYGNTVSDDLWREVEAAAGQPVTDIAHDFTLQPGVPLVTVADVACRGGTSVVTLAQGEFTKDRPDKQPLAWRVPVILRSGAGAPVRTLLQKAATVTVPGCDPVVVNAGQSGYYRTHYTPAQFARVAGAFGTLPAIDQMGLLSDSWALGRAGVQPISDVLDLARATPVEADPQVWGQVAQILGGLDGYARADRARGEAFRRFALARLQPVFARVGWTARAGETEPIAVLRNGLIGTLGALGDPAVIAEARRRFRAEATDPAAMPGPLRKTILRVVAPHADAATWEALHKAAVAEKTPLVKEELYFLLAAVEDEALVRRALDLALSSEPGTTTGAAMMARAAEAHAEIVFDFALAHMAAVQAKVDATSLSRYFANLARPSGEAATIEKLKAYAAAHLDESARGETETAIADIGDRIRVRERVSPALDAWLARSGKGR
ncbi:MAG: M1 family metallopeptidase [Vicinamibacteria bacterium]